jgi:hypothetical protein
MFNVGTLLLAGTYTPGNGMKLRSPVNFDLAMINQVSPAAQAGLRDFRRRGVMRNQHLIFLVGPAGAIIPGQTGEKSIM